MSSALSSITLKNPTSDTLSRFMLASAEGLNITLNNEAAEMTVEFPGKKPIKFHEGTKDPKIAFVETVAFNEMYVDLTGFDLIVYPDDKINYILIPTRFAPIPARLLTDTPKAAPKSTEESELEKTVPPPETIITVISRIEESTPATDTSKTGIAQKGCISRLFSSIWNCVVKAFKALVNCLCCRAKTEKPKESDPDEETMDLYPLTPVEMIEGSLKIISKNAIKETVAKESLERIQLV